MLKNAKCVFKSLKEKWTFYFHFRKAIYDIWPEKIHLNGTNFQPQAYLYILYNIKVGLIQPKPDNATSWNFGWWKIWIFHMSPCCHRLHKRWMCCIACADDGEGNNRAEPVFSHYEIYFPRGNVRILLTHTHIYMLYV